jgi:hypothetical protein
VLWCFVFVVTESSTGPITLKRFKEMNVAHVGVHATVAEVSLSHSYPELFQVTGPLPSLYFRPRTCGGGITNALANGRAVVRVLGSASLRADSVDRRRAPSRVGSISLQNEDARERSYGEARSGQLEPRDCVVKAQECMYFTQW